MSPAAVALQDSARVELRNALAARTDGRRVTFHARLADRIVQAIRHLHPDRRDLHQAAAELERVLPKLPADAAGHVSRALHHVRQAQAAIEG